MCSSIQERASQSASRDSNLFLSLFLQHANEIPSDAFWLFFKVENKSKSFGKEEQIEFREETPSCVGTRGQAKRPTFFTEIHN